MSLAAPFSLLQLHHLCPRFILGMKWSNHVRLLAHNEQCWLLSLLTLVLFSLFSLTVMASAFLVGSEQLTAEVSADYVHAKGRTHGFRVSKKYTSMLPTFLMAHR